MRFYSLPSELLDIKISRDLLGKWYVEKRYKVDGGIKRTRETYGNKEKLLLNIRKVIENE